MPDNNQLAERVWKIFAEPTPPQRKTFLENLPNLPEPQRIKVFSAFLQEHIDRVQVIIDRWNAMVTPGAADEETQLNKVLDDYESMKGKENPDLLYYALEVFLTHYDGKILFDIPSILVREPELAGPSKIGMKEKEQEMAVGSREETLLDRFREDPLLNEHHAHWHVVYYRRERYDRQGEMFLYMHQQMLARYDAERIAEGVQRVKPFSNMRNPIAVGYTAGPDLRLSEGELGSDREVEAEVSNDDARKQLADRAAIIRDIEDGKYKQNPRIADELVRETTAINDFGSVLESNVQARANISYLNYHGDGHGAIGNINTGVMLNTVTAIRDVVFWEWHKEVDTHFVRLQETFEPYDFSDAPPVAFQKGSNRDGEPDTMDVILCLSSDIPGYGSRSFDGAAIGEAAFGGDNWTKEFVNGDFSFTDNDGNRRTIGTTDTLRTNMNTGTVRYRHNGREQSYTFKYVNHDPFCYFIRVENTSRQQKQVTVRIFMAPESEANDRTMWIEMDKFLYELAPNSKTVIFRSDLEASVIRKPAQTDPKRYSVDFNPDIPIDDDMDKARCKCGWPYHLLLPKGKNSMDGEAYKLVVMMSDAEIDSTQSEEGCGSLSFCAARKDRYPDKRPLGYPFNRPFNGNGSGVMRTITSMKNFACRAIKIQHRGS